MLKDKYINPFTDFGFKKLYRKAIFDLYCTSETSLKYYRDLTNVTNTAYSEGEKKGREEGREKGIEEGMKLKNIEIAQKALSENIPTNIISVLTGLSEDEIIKLKNTL
jgi:predicted transposase/invertase (TIGR01784 family)